MLHMRNEFVAGLSDLDLPWMESCWLLTLTSAYSKLMWTQVSATTWKDLPPNKNYFGILAANLIARQTTAVSWANFVFHLLQFGSFF